MLRLLPDNCINCVVTNSSYYEVRNYNVASQIGLEEAL